MGKIEKIKFEFYMKKVRVMLFWIDCKTFIKKLIFCKRGYHKFEPNHLKVTTKSPGKDYKVVIDSEWLECRWCKLMLFKNKTERLKYLSYIKRECRQRKQLMKKLLKCHNTKKRADDKRK